MGDIARQRMNLGAYGAGGGLLLTLPLLPGEDQAVPLVGVNPLIAAGALGTAGAFAPELRNAYYQFGAGARPENIPDPAWYMWENMGPGYRSDYGGGFGEYYQGYQAENFPDVFTSINWETANPRQKATTGRIFGQMYQNQRRNHPVI